MNPAVERLIWVVNGFMVLLFSAADHIATLLLLLSMALFILATPNEQKPWALGAGALAFTASALAPAPVPLFLLVMSLSGWGALFLEKYNKPAMGWNIIRAISLYAVAGLGFTFYKLFGAGTALSSDPQMAQGATYLNALIGIFMYVIPIGFLVMVAQSIWAHPPAPGGRPAQLIGTVRTRGKN